jgi:hypothetical protein
MDKKVTILKPKRVGRQLAPFRETRRPKGMRKVRVARSVAPKPPGQLNVFHHFPGGGPTGGLISSTYAPPVMEQMSPNDARNDLVSSRPPKALDLPSVIEARKTATLLRSRENLQDGAAIHRMASKPGMFGPEGNIPAPTELSQQRPEGVSREHPGFQPKAEPIPLSEMNIPTRPMNTQMTQNESQTLMAGYAIENIPEQYRTTEEKQLLSEAKALRGKLRGIGKITW